MTANMLVNMSSSANASHSNTTVAMPLLGTVSTMTSTFTSSISQLSTLLTSSAPAPTSILSTSPIPISTTIPSPPASSSADSYSDNLPLGGHGGALAAIGPGSFFLLILFMIIKCHVNFKRRNGVAREPRRGRKWWGAMGREPMCDAPIAAGAVRMREEEEWEEDEEDVGMAPLERVVARGQ